MLDALPLFEEVDRQQKAQWGNLEWQSNKIISHRRSESQLGAKLRFPISGYDLTHKATLATSQLIYCLTQRGANPEQGSWNHGSKFHVTC